ncbi:MAG: cytochrome P450, partial [Acidimicrobiales bacterium]
MPTDQLPPGRLGLPFAGETLALLRNPFAFLETRRKKHGDVFKSRVLGRNVVFLSGVEGAEAFYDEDNISREHAHPYPILDLFGGVNMEMYDGPRHTALKAITTTAFDDAAIAAYLPDMQRLIESRLDGWAQQDEFSATAELRKLAIEVICLNLLGLEPGPQTDAIARDYAAVLKGIVSVPVPIPATPYRHARQARDRLLATIAGLVAERRCNPTGDGLSRMLLAHAPGGRTITDDEAVLEVHHVVIAGFIVYALMAEILWRLRESPILLARCAAEVDSGAALARLHTALQTVMEAKRLVPLVPLAFGRARREFTCGGYRVPTDWTVYLALRL